MNKIFTFFVLLPFFAVASYDLSPIEDCERLKENMIQDLNYQESTILEGINPALLTFTNRIDSLIGQVDAIRRLDTDDDFEMDLLNLRGNIASLNHNVYYTLDYSNNAYEYTQYLKATVNAINCTTCDGSSTSNCCDFTEILQAIGNVSNGVNIAVHELSVISNQLNSLEYTNFLLEHGFGSVTNLLIDSLFYNASLHEDLLQEWNNYHYQDFTGDNYEEWAYTVYDDAPFIALFNAYYFNQLQNVISANNYNYNWQYRIFPQFTNQFSSYRRDFSDYSNEATNFFSFFRGEIGVRGVLEDWQSEEVSGTYYDFLTNHYLSVVFGESLSGYQAEKTNWFSRIETLLAALVFVDESETNSYLSASEASSNSVSNAKDSFNSVFDGVSSAPSTQMELAVDIEKSMYNSLKSFSQAFSSASLPSTVRLLYVYKDGGGGGSLRKGSLRSSGGSVDVSVDVDGKLSDFIEILRSCSTLCWVFFGLWFMFKFTVWTVKKIYFLIRYIIDFFNMVAGGK